MAMVYVNDEISNKLKQMAKREMRSPSRQIGFLLSDHQLREKSLKNPAPQTRKK